MPTLDIISVNIWHILISLCNLALLFLIVKKFLFKPVRKVLQARQEAVDKQYTEADEARAAAEADRAAWEQKLAGADEKAEAILADAARRSAELGERTVLEAREKADAILRRAEHDAQLEVKKAEAQIKEEIVDVSALLTEQILAREITPADHRRLIDDFFGETGDGT